MAKTKNSAAEAAIVEGARDPASDAAAVTPQSTDTTQGAVEVSAASDAAVPADESSQASDISISADIEEMSPGGGQAPQDVTVHSDDADTPKQHLSREEVEAFGLDPFVYGYGKSVD